MSKKRTREQDIELAYSVFRSASNTILHDLSIKPIDSIYGLGVVLLSIIDQMEIDGKPLHLEMKEEILQDFWNAVNKTKTAWDEK